MRRRNRFAHSEFNKGRWMIECERLGLPMDTPVPVKDDVSLLSDRMSAWFDSMGIKDEAWMATLLDRWGAVAGAQVAKHARPGRVLEQQLIVYVDSSVWLNELSRYGQKRLLENIRNVLPESPITSIRFQLDPDGV